MANSNFDTTKIYFISVLSTPEQGHRQSRTYGHFVSFLLATLFTKAVAKYAASSILPLTHQPWFSNKPVNYLSFNQIQQPQQAWKPVSPYLHGLTAFAAGYQDHYSHPDPVDTPNVELDQISSTLNSLPGYHGVDVTLESPEIDQISSQSQFNYRRQPAPNRWDYPPRRNYPPRRDYENRYHNTQRNKYPSNRVRTTTSYYDYYDSYDDFETRQPERRTRPPHRGRPTPSSYDYLYDSSEYDGSSYEDYYEKTTKFYERTTKPYRRRKKMTKKAKTKKRTSDSEEDVFSEESVEELEKPEEKPKPRQATTTTESTTTESTESTTTEASTTVTTPSTTTAALQNVTQPSGYGPGGNYEHISFTYGPPIVHQEYSPPYDVHHNGYGPSRGNERISITQTPSFPLFYHNFPYTNLFPQELTKNAIVQKVHDIVGFDHDFVHRE